MDITYYDRFGRPTCYTVDGTNIFRFKGAPLAYFAADSVYSFSGLQLGWLDRGLIQDNTRRLRTVFSRRKGWADQTGNGGPSGKISAENDFGKECWSLTTAATSHFSTLVAICS